MLGKTSFLLNTFHILIKRTTAGGDGGFGSFILLSSSLPSSLLLSSASISTKGWADAGGNSVNGDAIGRRGGEIGTGG